MDDIAITERNWQLLKGQIDWSQFAVRGVNYETETHESLYIDASINQGPLSQEGLNALWLCGGSV